MYLNSATNWFFGVGDSQRRSSAKDQLLEASVLTELVICQGMNKCISHNWVHYRYQVAKWQLFTKDLRFTVLVKNLLKVKRYVCTPKNMLS